MRRVHVVVPEGIDDPSRPSGGNVYDRQVCDQLSSRGWQVCRFLAPGLWPAGGPAGRRKLGAYLEELPDDAVVLVDGLIGSAVPELLEPVAARLRLVMLVHMPLGTPDEDRSLRATRTVVTTSAWTAERLEGRVGARLHVALPGTERVEPALPDPAGRRLLVVGPVATHKGSDVLAAALTRLADLDWCLSWVGSLTVDRAAAAGFSDHTEAAGLGARVRLLGPRHSAHMGPAYAGADLLVLASREETYGMVVAEALGRGVPVVASDVGGVREALGTTAAGPPGRLVPAGDAGALAAALREWLTDAALRERWRAAALVRRDSLPSWSDTTDVVERALLGAA